MSPTVDTPDPGTQPNVPPTEEKKYSQQELDSHVNKARKDEKDKLYPDIEAQKTKISDLQVRLREANEKIDTLKAKNPNMNPDPAAKTENDKLVAEVESLKATLNTIQTKTDEAIAAALNRQKAEFDSILSTKDLESYRNRMIAEAGGKIIPELVNGNSREEVDAAVAKAKQRYEEIFGTGAKAKETELQEQLKGNLPRPVTPGAGDVALSDVEGGIDAWRKMPEKDWEQKQAEIKAKVYKDVGLPMRK